MREFLGTLLINNINKGYFVSASNFTKDSRIAVKKARMRGKAVELIDSHRFYEMMNIGIEYDKKSLECTVNNIKYLKMHPVNFQCNYDGLF